MSAEDWFKKAEGKANKTFFKDYEGAFEYFQKAGAQFKLDKNYDRAGDAYMRAGDCATRQKDAPSACQAYTDSANCYKKVDMSKASTMLNIAIQINIEEGRLLGAARLEKDFAEALDQDGSKEEAIKHYRKAMQYFDAEDQPQQRQSCLVKVANILGELDKFEEAAEVYETLGMSYASGPLKHQAKEMFLRSMLCHLAQVNNDNRLERSVECHDCLERFETFDIHLKNTREDEFLHMVTDAVEGSDTELFDAAVGMLEDLRMLDPWKTHVLLIIRKGMDDLK